MALISSNNFLFANPVKNMGGQALGLMRNNFSQTGEVRNQFAGGYSQYQGTPRGYLAPYSWIIPTKDGGISTSAERMAASGSLNAATLGSGYPITTAMNATLSVTDAALGLIVALEIALAASGTITDAELAASAALVASMSASGTLTNVELGAIVSMVTALQASGTLTATTLVGAFMEWNVGGPTALSPEGLAKALLDDYDIENGFSMKEAIRLILSATAGKVSGADTTTVTIRSVTDGTNRIVATVDTNGNRNSVTYDLGDE